MISETDMYTGIPTPREALLRFSLRTQRPFSAIFAVRSFVSRHQDRIIRMPRKIHGHDTRYMKMQKNNCFACGQNNPDGMRLKFTLDEQRQTFVCKFRLSKRYTGPPGHCHGGIIATILDDAMGKVNKLHHVVALTREMTVEYLKPVPLHKPLHVEGREVSVRGRQHINEAEIRNEKNEILARSKGVFIAIDPDKMFAKFVER
jgi:uncharacterized protein (TIGR00369 family)